MNRYVGNLSMVFSGARLLSECTVLYGMHSMHRYTPIAQHSFTTGDEAHMTQASCSSPHRYSSLQLQPMELHRLA